MGPDPEADPSAAVRELAGRRRDLEREFDAKLRDLKAQHKRLADSLEQDRKDWEERKRVQAKELADREEKVRRREDNRDKASEAKADDRKQLEALRLRVRELEERNLDARNAAARLDERMGKAAKSYAGALHLVTAVTGVAIIGALTWVVTALQAGDGVAVALAALFLAATVFLGIMGRRLRKA